MENPSSQEAPSLGEMRGPHQDKSRPINPCSASCSLTRASLENCKEQMPPLKRAHRVGLPQGPASSPKPPLSGFPFCLTHAFLLEIFDFFLFKVKGKGIFPDLKDVGSAVIGVGAGVDKKN